MEYLYDTALDLVLQSFLAMIEILFVKIRSHQTRKYALINLPEGPIEIKKSENSTELVHHHIQ
jgi:hypothetical protein